MVEKCFLCGEKIGESFLGKIDGTIISIERNTATGREYVCSDCQREHKDNIKKIVNSKN